MSPEGASRPFWMLPQALRQLYGECLSDDHPRGQRGSISPTAFPAVWLAGPGGREPVAEGGADGVDRGRPSHRAADLAFAGGAIVPPNIYRGQCVHGLADRLCAAGPAGLLGAQGRSRQDWR